MRQQVETIESKSINKVYTDSFKRKLVEQIEAGYLTVKEARLKYGIRHSVMQYWICVHGKDARQRGELHFQKLQKELRDITERNRLWDDLSTAKMEVELYKRVLELTKKEYGIDFKKNFGLWL